MKYHINDPDMDVIGKMLNYALLPQFDHSGEQDGVIDLGPECIWSAMHYIKNKPEASIEEACEFAINEWIK